MSEPVSVCRSRLAGDSAAASPASWLLLALAVAGLLLAACGESSQVPVYKEGKYQGKADTPPWSNAPYNGDRAKWENAIRERGLNQHEYRRAGA